MQITDRNGNQLWLCMAAIDESRDDYAEFYRVDGVLALQATPPGVMLTGHPGMDMPTPDECGQQLAWYEDELRPEQVRALNRWLSQGRFVAFRYNAGGTVRLEPVNGSRYLTAEQIAWLKTYAQTSHLWQAEQDAAKANAENIAISGDSAGADDPEAAQAELKRKATKKQRKSTAKQRRQQRIEEYYG
jgi:hypothetical protein